LRRLQALFAPTLVALLLTACEPGRRSFEEPLILGGVEVAPEVLVRGEILYMQHCRGCHGLEGRGDGRYAGSLDPRPADLTTGAYPRIGAVDGALPTDEQLQTVLTRGIDGTGMRAIAMPDEDRDAVVQYIKTLAPAWRQELLRPHAVGGGRNALPN
jgi:mono/diheme cytochrome c family protein